MRALMLAFALGSLIAATAGQVQACSCGRFGPFLDAVEDSDLVVRGRIVDHRYIQPRSIVTYGAMGFEISETLKGKSDEGLIEILGGDGVNCYWSIRPGLFPVDAELVLAIEQTEDNKYYLRSCAHSWLSVHEGLVGGSIDSTKPTKTTYEDLVQRIAEIKQKSKNENKGIR